MKSFKRNPIIDQFRLARKSCNEWRDTLFYTGLVAVGVASTQWNLGIRPDQLINAAGWRELVRAGAWHPLISSKDSNIFSSARAVIAGNSLFLLSNAAIGFETHNPSYFLEAGRVDTIIRLVIMGVGLRYSHGSRAMWNDYKDKLFDYPRKIKPPGKPRKTSSLEKFRDAWNGIKDRLGAPVPGRAFVPIRVTCDSRTPATQTPSA